MVAYAATASLYYEGWGQPPWNLLSYVVPWVVCLALCLLALRSPRVGSLLLFAGGAIGGGWWLTMQAGRGGISVQAIFTFCILFGPVLIASGLFLLEARHRRLLREEGVEPSRRWIGRNYRYLLVIGAPVLAVVIVSAMKLPQVLSRLDDGFRGLRTIRGNGVTLVWAPAGPGWNEWQPGEGYLSWDMIALYGEPPVGLEGKSRADLAGASPESMERTSLCAHLDRNGTELVAEPSHLWRMPTADEIVRSLTRDGENAGCTWDGSAPHAECRRNPDKETPLWAPDERPIYYWAAGEYDSEHAWCVNYTGGLNRQPKSSRTVGFRCVRELPRSRGDR
jgi:hypothetical protein